MYCSTCAAPLTAGLSYCNRCGANLKEREEPKSDAVSAYLTTIFLLGLGGLGLMLGGALALKNGAQMHEGLIGVFMLMAFSLIGIVEVFLCRQLSRVIDKGHAIQPPTLPTEFRGPGEFRNLQPRVLPEPVPSVTENTTRTLEFSQK